MEKKGIISERSLDADLRRGILRQTSTLSNLPNFVQQFAFCLWLALPKAFPKCCDPWLYKAWDLPPPETTAPCKIHTKKRVPGWFHHRWGTNSCLLPEMLTFSHSQDNGTVVTRRHHTEDTYIGIRSLVCTRALESDKLVAALVHHETADWNAKKRRNITQDSWLLAHADPTAAINNNCAEFLGHSSEAALGKVENWRQIHTQVCWFKGHKRKRGHQWELHNLVWRQDLKKSNVSTRNGLYGKSLMLVQYEMGQWEMLQRRAEQLRSVDVARHHVINTGVSKMWGWFCPRQR